MTDPHTGDPELAEAEHWGRAKCRHGEGSHPAAVLMAEYDRRGRVMDCANAAYLGAEAELDEQAAELSRLRRIEAAARTVAAAYAALPHPEDDDGSYWRLGDAGELEAAIRDLAAEVEKP